MPARSIRAALFTSLGLIPSACHDQDATGISDPTDVQLATPDAAAPATGAAVCGRPFLVAGEARVAPLRDGGDWVTGDFLLEPLAPLTAQERELIGQHWARNALLEHASIAAFARFTLQLLQLGAPRDLIERSQRAMLDETAHAQACFELAAGYLATPRGPGCLPIDAALEENDLEQVVVLAFREGCVGETVATLEAREALVGASDARVQRALERIAPDELQHAELAWRFVRWSLVTDPRVRRALQAEVALLEAEIARLDADSCAATPAATCPALSAHGVLTASQLARVRRDALAEIVLPCARQLLSYPVEQCSPSALRGPGSQPADELALRHRV